MKTNHHQQNRKAQQARRAARKARTAQLPPVITVATEPLYGEKICPLMPNYNLLCKLTGRLAMPLHPDHLPARAAMAYFKFPRLLLFLASGGRLYE